MATNSSILNALIKKSTPILISFIYAIAWLALMASVQTLEWLITQG